MFKPSRKTHPLFKIINNALIDLPAAKNLSNIWSFGSIAGLCLGLQILTGLLLAIQYTPNIEIAFSSIIYIIQDVNHGWLIRIIHANTASFFFLCLYIHIGRGIYYISYFIHEVWNIGVVLLILTIAAGFIGYVLVWGQIRFWGATVITNLFSAIPYFGPTLVKWIWGGFTVGNATLNRFFALHFFIPFVIAALAIIHLLFLHTSGSSNPLGISSNSDKIPFHWYYTSKDLLGFLILLFILAVIVLSFPNILGDPENFLPANPIITPIHIKPEWYFLWAYAILRSIPNKLGGVIAIFSAILLLSAIRFSYKRKRIGLSFYPPAQILYWSFIRNIALLTWIGGSPVEYPYDFLGLILTINYFLIPTLISLSLYLWDKFIP